MGNDTCARGVPARACSPGKFLKKRCYLVHSERSKIINLKINYFRDNKSTTTKNIRHILSSTNPDVHVNKQKHFIKGSLGHESPPPSEAKNFLTKINKMEAFP